MLPNGGPPTVRRTSHHPSRHLKLVSSIVPETGFKHIPHFVFAMSGQRLGRMLRPWKKADLRPATLGKESPVVALPGLESKKAEAWKKRRKKMVLQTSRDVAVILNESLVMLRDSADACPPLKSVTGGLVRIVQTIEVSVDV